MSVFKKHVFVCTTGKTCPTKDSEQVCANMKELVHELGLKKEIRINKAGCMGQCSEGPIVVVYPEATWYAGVTTEDVTEIVHQHLVGDQPVARLHYQPKPKE